MWVVAYAFITEAASISYTSTEYMFNSQKCIFGCG